MNAIERDGETIHLEPKVMQVLITLAANAGEVVTREQLRIAVWPDVFVGEDVLIRAISELRRAFSDEARDPRFIQTVPKVGYRLIAEVTNGPYEPAEAATASVAVPAELAPPAPPISGKRFAATSRPGRILMVGLGLSAVVIVAAWIVAGRHHKATAHGEAYTRRPLTTYPGSQLQPSFSPDGSAVAFVWLKGGNPAGHIYVKLLGSEAPSRLTSGTAEELSPAWSPDGRWIAFMRHDQTRTSVVIVPAIGGSEQEVYTLPTNHVWEFGGIAWTPDGGSLIFPQQDDAQAPSKLVQVDIKRRAIQQLTSPPAGWDGDWTPEVSPDGKELAFIRGPEGSVHDIYIVGLAGGQPRRVTNDGRLIDGLTWTSDGSSIVYASNRSGSLSLWRVSAKGGAPEHESAGGDDAASPSISRQGNRMVYSHGSAIWNILAVEIGRNARHGEEVILSSSQQDASPHVSPAGDKLIFQSWRSGAQEIWTSGIDGSDPVQLTSMNASAGSPFWSHDGRRIAFDARADLFAHIYVIDSQGGAPHPITKGNWNDIVPSWSADDRWIYFGSNRSGSWQIWKTPSDGSGPARQVTRDGGMVAIETLGDRSVYMTHYAEPGLWTLPIDGGTQRKVFDGPPAGNLNYWTVADGAVYALTLHEMQFTIDRVDPATGHDQIVYTFKHSPTPFAGMSVTPDGRRLIFAELDQASSGLTVVEHFE